MAYVLHRNSVSFMLEIPPCRWAERFNYDSNDDELAELGKKIEAITAASVHVVLNNNYEDQGQRNARTLMRFVGRSLATKAP
jgi:uncharacterized protein YecE (DUF72 family)